MAANNLHNSDENKVFDVSKPGKTAASASSRPLIVGHGPMMKDPMVRGEQSDEINQNHTNKEDQPIEEDIPSGSPSVAADTESGPEEKQDLAPAESHIKIEPVEDKAEETDKETAEPAEASEHKEKTTEAEKDSEPETKNNQTADEEPKDETEDKKNKPGSTETIDGKSEDTMATTEAQKKAEKEAQDAKAKKEQLEKLIIDKKYFVPIGEKTRKKRSLRHILIGAILILALGLVLTDLMIDVGIIKTSIKPPVKVFSKH